MTVVATRMSKMVIQTRTTWSVAVSMSPHANITIDLSETPTPSTTTPPLPSPMTTEFEPSSSVGTIRGIQRLNTMIPLTDDRADSPLPSPSSPSGESVSSLPSVSSSFLFSSGPTSPPHGPTEFEDGQGLIIPSLTLPSPGRRATPWGQMVGDLRLLFLAPRFASMDARTLASALLTDNDDVVDSGEWEDDEDGEGGHRATILRASTHWIEQRDAHGLEHTEPAHNIELVEVPPYDPGENADSIVSRTLARVHAPFGQVYDTLSPQCSPNAVLAGLLASASSPLYTALILLLTTGTSYIFWAQTSRCMQRWRNPGSIDSARSGSPELAPEKPTDVLLAPSPAEKALITTLSAHIPLVVFPPFSPPPRYPTSSSYPYTNTYLDPPRNALPADAALSAFRPLTPSALRTGLFRSPDTLALLRAEAAERFLRWREVERAAVAVPASLTTRRGVNEGGRTIRAGSKSWNKAEWEAQWEGSLSQDVAVRRRARTSTVLVEHAAAPRAGSSSPKPKSKQKEGRDGEDDGHCVNALDPLHIPSLIVFSFSLLGPLRRRMVRTVRTGLGWAPAEEAVESEKAKVGRGFGLGLGLGLGLALVGAFCAGIGIGLLVARV